jgi:MarR family transcriptional regulator for hemolysin
MKMISTEKSMIQQDLAQMLKSDKSSMLRQLDKLQKEMLVARMPDESDKRKKILVLTACGAKLLEKGEVLEKQFFGTLNNHIEKDEIDTFLKVLQQLRRNTELE